MKNNQSWQERIRERFREKFIHIDTVEGYKTCNTKADIADLEKFLLQEGEKIRRDAIEETIANIRIWAHLMVVNDDRFTLDALIAKLDKLKSDGEGE